MSWLLDGLREVAELAKRRPEMAQRVHDQPSGYFAHRECPADCEFCVAAAQRRKS